eukprot:Pompholyxophrys_punicea_v1_NODE_1038_length_1021_cov_4.249482.p2 type:complete len:117 gc:universal NODE_1038_length_1021_cov_4.249482:135-485(+)
MIPAPSLMEEQKLMDGFGRMKHKLKLRTLRNAMHQSLKIETDWAQLFNYLYGSTNVKPRNMNNFSTTVRFGDMACHCALCVGHLPTIQTYSSTLLLKYRIFFLLQDFHTGSRLQKC